MKTGQLIVIAFILLIGIASCSKKNILVLTNPQANDRPDETIVVGRAQFESMFGPAAEGTLPALKLNGTFVPSQADDLDGDGKWDELVFTVSLKASEELSLTVENVPATEYPQFEKRTNLRLGIPKEDGTFEEVDHYVVPNGLDAFPPIAQGEGVGWENEKMAFRVYADCRNVKDLFGKLKPGMILDKVHTPELGDYHVLADWGMDILHCGSSLGSGGLALLEADSLYRLGSTDSYEYQKVVEGPVRSVFDLKYKGWHVAGQNLEAVERISIYPNKYWFQSDVTVTGFTGEKQLATGIVTSRLTKEPVQFDAGKLSYAIATLDSQSLNNDVLGMAVLLKRDELTKVGRTTNINYFNLGYATVPSKEFSIVVSDTYYEAQKIQNGVPARHYFFAVWGLENPKWNDLSNFEAYINEEAEKIENPIQLKVQ